MSEPLVGVVVGSESDRERMQAALDELGPQCRKVFIMRRFDEYSTGDISRELGISARMVQKHLTRAVTHLYQRLGDARERRT